MRSEIIISGFNYISALLNNHAQPLQNIKHTGSLSAVIERSRNKVEMTIDWNKS
ncbi:MAG: hypothetical protein LBN23_07215 [Paludibacter sp.]|nr:hypothetical protein [Paludibacter sp.]